MLDRLFTECMIKPGDIVPSNDAMRVVGVCNPGAAAYGDGVVLLVRVVEQPIETRPGMIASPRVDPDQGVVIDWLEEHEYDTRDPRLVRHKKTGALRLLFLSYLKVVHTRDGKTPDDFNGTVVFPDGPYEAYGIEDPRITQINNTYYITYVAVGEHGICTSMLSTVDFVTFRHHGVIFCMENKDVVLFPEKVMGNYVAMHRPSGSANIKPPEIWLARSPDLIHWGTHTQLLGPTKGSLEDRIGGGTPPIRTREGWLCIFHRSIKSDVGDLTGMYAGFTLLLDLDNPAKVLGMSQEPVMIPEHDFEKEGFLGSVVFPTGIVDQGGQVLVYYGAADECIGVTAFEREALLDSLSVPLAD